jgi:hypothetical protein
MIVPQCVTFLLIYPMTPSSCSTTFLTYYLSQLHHVALFSSYNVLWQPHHVAPFYLYHTLWQPPHIHIALVSLSYPITAPHHSKGNQASSFQNWAFSFNMIFQANESKWWLDYLRRNKCPIWALKIKYPSLSRTIVTAHQITWSHNPWNQN